MKYLIIVRGIPGSGKSTLAELISEGGKYPICCADDWFYKTYGYYKWSFEDSPKAHKYSQDLCRFSMTNNIDKIIIANTSTTESEMEPYINMAKEFNYRVITLIVENRHDGKSIHGVPEETLEKMRKRFSIKI